MKKICFAAILVAVVVACAQPTAQTSPEIRALSDQWEAALQAGDAAAIAAFYSEDCRILAPNTDLATGRSAAEAAFGGMIDAGLTGELETVEATVVGDLGFNLGTYTLQAADGSLVDRGKFIEIWRQVNGEWKITDDIWNSDLAAAPAGTTLMLTHEVGDPDKWLAAWQGPEGRHALFAQSGASGVRVFQSPDNANLTGLLVQVEDMDTLQTMLASPEGQSAATEDSVKFDTLQSLMEVQ